MKLGLDSVDVDCDGGDGKVPPSEGVKSIDSSPPPQEGVLGEV